MKAPFGALNNLRALHVLICALAGLPATQATGGLVSHLPIELALDRPLGTEGPIVVRLHLEDGEELPLMVDTGSCFTLLDASLTPKLGPQLGTRPAAFSFNLKAENWGIYPAPKLFAGDLQLLTGRRVFTTHRPARDADKGILGTDCLCHYCVQLDFAAGKLRFLDPEHLDTTDLGQAFSMPTRSTDLTCFDANLFGYGRMRFILDTGMSGPFDAMLAGKLFRRLLREQPTIGPDLYMIVADGRRASGNIFPRLNLCGRTYSELWFSMVDPRPRSVKGLIGVGFLARHKVTLNFPKGTLYLKCVSPGPMATKSLR